MDPNAERPASTGHGDGSEALPHYAWLYSREANGNFYRRVALTGADLVVSAGGALSVDLTHFPDLKPIVQRWPVGADDSMNPLGDADRVIARITLDGGALSAGQGAGEASAYDWTMNDTMTGSGSSQTIVRMAFVAKWVGPADAIDVTFRESGAESIPGEGRTFWITHTCARRPDEWSLSEPAPGPVELVDDDFKWIYRLLDPAGNAWDDADWSGSGPFPLPAPSRLVSVTGGQGRPSTCTGGGVVFP